MARPKTNTVDYFPMFSHTSKTCEMLQAKYGSVGYAFFYKLLQLLANEDGHFYDARDPMSIEFLEQKLCCNEVSVTEMLGKLSSWNKIDRELWGQKIIWYQGFVNTLEPVYKKRERDIPTKFDISEKLGVSVTETRVSGTETTPKPSFPEQTGPESTQSKVNNTKLNNINNIYIHKGKIKKNIFLDNVLLTDDDYCELLISLGDNLTGLAITKVSLWKKQKGHKPNYYADDKSAIENWALSAALKENPNIQERASTKDKLNKIKLKIIEDKKRTAK